MNTIRRRGMMAGKRIVGIQMATKFVTDVPFDENTGVDIRIRNLDKSKFNYQYLTGTVYPIGSTYYGIGLQLAPGIVFSGIRLGYRNSYITPFPEYAKTTFTRVYIDYYLHSYTLTSSDATVSRTNITAVPIPTGVQGRELFVNINFVNPGQIFERFTIYRFGKVVRDYVPYFLNNITYYKDKLTGDLIEAEGGTPIFK